MATTTVTPLALAKNVFSITQPITDGTAIVAGNSHKIAFAQEDKLVVRVKNTFAGAKNITVKAGDFLANGQGDLVQAFAQDEERFLVLESVRFKDFDGNVDIQVEAATTGFIMALTLP